MNVYRIDDGEVHLVVAESEFAACKFVIECASEAESVDAYREIYEPTIERLAPDKLIGVTEDDGKKVYRTAAEWAADGAGYLAGSMW